MRIISWNVAGLRGAAKKGFKEWLDSCGADLVLLQETKAYAEQLPADLRNPPGWGSRFVMGERKGYSGVGAYWPEDRAPDELIEGLGEDRFDVEGRVLRVRFGDIWFYGNYFPNGGKGPERVRYKLDFYDRLLEQANGLRDAGAHVCIGGDWNTAHQEYDLSRPRENSNVSGFLPEEREWLDRFVADGWSDAYRVARPDEREVYSWWSWRSAARERNIGWRIDSFFVSPGLVERIEDCRIDAHVQGSDHAPIVIELG